MTVATCKMDYPDVTVIPLGALSPMVGYDEKIINMIRESWDGKLLYPIVVVALSTEEWLEEKATSNPDIYDPPFIEENTHFLRVQCGNNRVQFLIEEGYDAVECIVLNLEEAKKICSKNRKDKQWKN